MLLRDFLYLDNRLVEQYLAQVEDGLYDEEEERSVGGTSRVAEAGLKVGPASAAGSRARGASDEISRTRRQTPESRFNRLIDQLFPTKIDSQFSNVYGAVQTRDLVEVECYIDVPSMARAISQAGDFAGIAQLASAFGEEIDGETRDVLDGVRELSERVGGSLVATGETREDEPVFVFKLDATNLRVAVDDLEGDAVVVGQVVRKWPEGESHPVLSIPGINLLSRAERRKMAKEGRPAGDSADEEAIPGPGVTVNVVAIFR